VHTRYRCRLDRILFPFCTDGPQPRIFFFGVGGYANVDGSLPIRYCCNAHNRYLRSFTAKPFSLSVNPSIFHKSSQLSTTNFSSFDRPIAFRRSFAVFIDPLGGGTGRRTALFCSDLDSLGVEKDTNLVREDNIGRTASQLKNAYY